MPTVFALRWMPNLAGAARSLRYRFSRGASPLVLPTPVTRLAAKGAGRSADGQANFFIGEEDFLYAHVMAAVGQYTITAATFQLLQNGYGITPPNGSVDYTFPISTPYRDTAPAQDVFCNVFLNTAQMNAGTYKAKFVLNVTDSSMNNLIMNCECDVIISAP